MTLKEVGIIGVIMAFLLAGAAVMIQNAEPKAAAEAMYPEPTNYAVDTTGTLTPEQLAELNANLKTMNEQFGNHEIAVAIVNTTAPLDITQYGIKLAEKWKVGDADTDNGAILIVAVEDRQVRIEVGYGLEGDLTDSEAGRILDNDVVPSLKLGNWYGGILSGVSAISHEVNK